MVTPLDGLGAGARSRGYLGAISRCEIPFRCRRDCAEIAHLHPGHLEALPSGGARRSCRGGIGNGRVRSDSTKWPSTVVVDAWVFEGNMSTRAKTLQDALMRQAPPYSATLSNRNKPGHSRYLRGVLRALRHPVGPVGNQEATVQSRRNLAYILDESHT